MTSKHFSNINIKTLLTSEILSSKVNIWCSSFKETARFLQKHLGVLRGFVRQFIRWLKWLIIF